MSYLTNDEVDSLATLRKERPFVEAALNQLDRILKCPRFQRCLEHTRGFLEFVVELTLIGKLDAIKESTIARRVFQPASQTSGVSAVRESARMLRRRLKEYYGREGRRDPVKITI